MKDKTSKNSSVEKALEIVECFNNKRTTLTLEDLVSITGYPKTTTFRLVNSLEKYGYLKADKQFKETRYSLGWVFLSKGNLVSKQLNIRELAYESMMRLRNETGLTVQLAIRDGSEAVYIEQFESLKPIQLYPQIGKRAPLYAAACPRVLLTFLPETEQEEILKQADFKAYTPQTLTNVQQVKAEMLTIKKAGYAVSRGELHEGTVAVAAPVFVHDEQVVAAISIVGMEGDFKNGHLDRCIPLVQKCASTVSMKLKDK